MTYFNERCNSLQNIYILNNPPGHVRMFTYIHSIYGVCLYGLVPVQQQDDPCVNLSSFRQVKSGHFV